MIASDVLDVASMLLLDEDNDRWPSAELIEYLNVGQKMLVKHKPSASKYRTTVALTAEQTQQSCPADNVLLIDVAHNVLADDSIGKEIHYADKESLTHFNPTWNSDDSEIQADSWMYDADIDRDTFWIHPAVRTGAQAEIVYSRLPTVVTDVGDTLVILDDFLPALVDYVCARALSKDSEHHDFEKAEIYYARFAETIGLRKAAEVMAKAKNEDTD